MLLHLIFEEERHDIIRALWNVDYVKYVVAF